MSINSSHFLSREHLIVFICWVVFTGLSLTATAVSPSVDQDNKSKFNDNELLEKFVSTYMYSSCIVFSDSNIKQYWTDKTVYAKDGMINISLSSLESNNYSSIPLPIKLANVFESMDCVIDTISNEDDFSFSVINSKGKIVSSSNSKDDFINYHIQSASFHLEETLDKSFKIIFHSKSRNEISVKKILLSFSDNKNSIYVHSPGKLSFIKDNILVSNAKLTADQNIVVLGKNSVILSQKNIYVEDSVFNFSVKIKNIGNTATTIYVGYRPYSFNHYLLANNSLPYKGINKILKVLSYDSTNNTIIVDSYTDWTKNCYIEINPNEDLMNISRVQLLNARVSEITKKTDGTAEIKLTQSIDNAIRPGDHIRINGQNGGVIYTNSKTLSPGQEEVFSSSIQKDNELNEYSNNAFLRFYYYVKPVIMSYSKEDAENTIEISDFSVVY